MNRSNQVTGARRCGVEGISCARTLGWEAENLFEKLKDSQVVGIFRERTGIGITKGLHGEEKSL